MATKRMQRRSKKTPKKTTKKRTARKTVSPELMRLRVEAEIRATDAQQVAETLKQQIDLENLARRRVAEFMSRTLNVSWMRERVASFETALLGGLRNLLAESAKDLMEGRSMESREAVCFFLFGVFSSLRTVFYREAMHARVTALSSSRGRLTPTETDVNDAVFEARIYDLAAQREDVLRRFRTKLALAEQASDDALMRQAKLYDTLNPSKAIPKA